MENEISFGELTVNSDEVPVALFSTTTLDLLLQEVQVFIKTPAIIPQMIKKEERNLCFK